MILHLLGAIACASVIAVSSVSAVRSVRTQKNNDFMYYLHDTYTHDNRLSINLTDDDSSSWNLDFYCYDYDSSNELTLQQVSHDSIDVDNSENTFYYISTFCNYAPYNLTTETQFNYVVCVAHLWSDIGRVLVIPYFSDSYIDYRVSINFLLSQYANARNFYVDSSDAAFLTFVKYERCFPINYWDYIQNGYNSYRYNMISSYIYCTTNEDVVPFNFNIPILQFNNYEYISQGYQKGYNDGYNGGYNEGISDGYEHGYEVGHHDGYIEGVNEQPLTLNFLTMLGAIADTPVLIIRNLFSFEFFGISALAVFMTLLTACLVIYFLRKIL